MAEGTAPTGGEGYRPRDHLLRTLRIAIDGRDGLATGSMPLPDEVKTEGGANLGVLATLADVVGGNQAILVSEPDWIATSDLAVRACRPATGSSVRARCSVLRAGRTTISIRVEIGDDDEASGPVALASLTFLRVRARGGLQDHRARQAGRYDFSRDGVGFEAPVAEAIGVKVLDADAGVLEAPLLPRTRNTLGAMNGGALAIVIDTAARNAARGATGSPVVIADLAIHYLRLAKVGPVETRTRLLRRDGDCAVHEVEVFDRGASRDRPTTVATTTSWHF